MGRGEGASTSSSGGSGGGSVKIEKQLVPDVINSKRKMRGGAGTAAGGGAVNAVGGGAGADAVNHDSGRKELLVEMAQQVLFSITRGGGGGNASIISSIKYC